MHAYKPTWFEQTLRSVLEQTYTNIEIIIGDDNADGEIKKIVDDLTKGDPRVRYFKNDPPFRGWGAGNRYFCLSKAKGDLIKYLCDDDLLYPSCIEYMVKALKDHPDVALVSSFRHTIDENGEVQPPHPAARRILYEDSIIEGIRAINIFHGMGTNMIGEPSSTMFRTELARQYQFYPDFLGGVEPESGLDDISLWFSLLCKGRFFYFAEPISAFRVSLQQASHQFAQRWQGKWENLKSLLYTLGGYEMSDMTLNPRNEIEQISYTDATRWSELIEIKQMLKGQLSRKQAKKIFQTLKGHLDQMPLHLALNKVMMGQAFPKNTQSGARMAEIMYKHHYFSNDYPANMPQFDLKKGFLHYVAELQHHHLKMYRIKGDPTFPRIHSCKYSRNGGPLKEIPVDTSKMFLVGEKEKSLYVEDSFIFIESFEGEGDSIYQFWGYDEDGNESPVKSVFLLSLFLPKV